MNLRPFGRTDLVVSELCLGTMHFGWKTDERTSAGILDDFRAAGGNFVQSASTTSCEGGLDLLASAQAEKHVGKWLESRRVPRADVVLATRLVVRDPALTGKPLARHLRRHCEASLRRLRTDHLDLLLCEWSPALLPVDRLLEGLWPLVRDGLVRYVGASGFPAWRVMEAHGCAVRRSLPRFEAMQCDFSLLARRPFETEFADLCQETRLAFLARSPLAGGFLVDPPLRRRSWATAGRAGWLRDRFLNDRSLGVRDVLEAIALGRGASVAQTALAWVLARPAVTSAVIGVVSTEQLAGLVGATRPSLSDRELALLENPAALPPSVLLGTSRPVVTPVADRKRARMLPMGKSVAKRALAVTRN